MSGRVIQIPHTLFTVLPNPTYLPWPRGRFSLPRLFVAFERWVFGEENVFKRLDRLLDRRVRLEDPTFVHLGRLTVGRLALSLIYDMDQGEDDQVSPLGNNRPRLHRRKLGKLHEALEYCGASLHSLTGNREVSDDNENHTLSVMRSHFQVLLALANPGPRETHDINGCDPGPNFQDLDSTEPENKEAVLMEIYFCTVFPQVISCRGRQPLHLTIEIWVILVFRMLCWLSLHDFHPDDVYVDELEAAEARWSKPGVSVYLG